MLGRRLAHYRIVEALGAGGMGQVYRARDERLDRDVALKILPPGLLHEEAARRRFRKETQALSRINHPHVATLLDAASVGAVDFLVMELVPGPNLKEELHHRRLTEEEVLHLSSQLLRGLQAAHEIGVVHRDIKPTNLALTSDGLLKILDFGLARLVPVKPAAASSDTETTVGEVAGSPPYMAPEQLRGRAVDARSDLYAAGAVMYEMATGQRVFGTLTGVDLTDAILNRPPRPPRELGGRVTPGLEAVILKLLDKDPRLRYQSAREVLVDLGRLERGMRVVSPASPSAPPLEPEIRSWRLVAGALGVFLLGILAAGLFLTTDGRIAPGGGAIPVNTAPVLLTPLTSSPGSERYPALSDSGRRLAYIGDGEGDGNTEVFVKDLGAHQAVAVSSSELPECCVTWMPDERNLVFVRLTGSKGAVIAVGAGGGPERHLTELVPWFGTKLSLSPDGTMLAYSDRASRTEPFAVHVLDLETGESRRITQPSATDIGDAFATFSPDGRHLAFARISDQITVADLWAVSLTGGAPRQLTSHRQFVGDLEWVPSGRGVVFWAERSHDVSRMWYVGLDGGEPMLHWRAGDPLSPRRVAEAEAISNVSDSFRFSVARRGGQIALTRSTYDSDIWEMAIGPESGKPTAHPLIASTQTDESPQFSPDGNRIAFSSFRSGGPQVWICNRAGEGCAPLLSASTHDGTPRWSPEGTQIAFDARPERVQSDVFVVAVDSRLVRRLTDDEAQDVVPSWSRDGRWVYFASNRTGRWQIYKVPPSGGEPRQVTTKGGFAAFESPSGESLLYTRFDSPGLWSMPLEGGPETQISDEPRCWGHWAVGPRDVYVAASSAGRLPRLLRLDPETGEASHVADLPRRLPCGESALAVSSDDRRVLFAGIQETSDLVLVRPEGEASQPLGGPSL